MSAMAEERRWDAEFGAGVAYLPDYEGSSTVSPRLRIWADGAYRTEGCGTFALDSGSLTIPPEARWDFVDSPDAAVGVLAGYRTGRTDNNPGFTSANDGSARLRGVPNVGAAVDVGVTGHLTFLSVPVFGQLRSALNSPQGTLVILGAYLSFEPTSNLEVTILPTATWANARQMRAFFGVNPSAAQASGFPAYSPAGGWQNASLEIGAAWHIGDGWHFVASVAYQRLLSAAARSPLVRSTNQPGILAGIAFSL
jgi:outer membrane scaffolding protein for murein synthesis (MipA/OmpV family)